MIKDILTSILMAILLYVCSFHAYIGLALAAVCVCLALVYVFGKKPEARLRRKAAASFCFALLGIFQSLCFWEFDTGPLLFPLLTTAGLTAGAVGDVLLENASGRGIKFAGGVLSFAAGHLLYSAAFISEHPEIAGISAASAAVLAAVITIPLLLLLDVRGGMRIAVPLYAFLLAFTASCAVVSALTSSDPRFYVIAPGAVFFFVSDLLLAVTMYGKKKRKSLGRISLLFYYAGQIMIAYGIYIADPVKFTRAFIMFPPQ